MIFSNIYITNSDSQIQFQLYSRMIKYQLSQSSDKIRILSDLSNLEDIVCFEIKRTVILLLSKQIDAIFPSSSRIWDLQGLNVCSHDASNGKNLVVEWEVASYGDVHDKLSFEMRNGTSVNRITLAEIHRRRNPLLKAIQSLFLKQ